MQIMTKCDQMLLDLWPVSVKTTFGFYGMHKFLRLSAENTGKHDFLLGGNNAQVVLYMWRITKCSDGQWLKLKRERNTVFSLWIKSTQETEFPCDAMQNSNSQS